MSNTIKIDDAVMKLLDLKTINRLICNTDKGTLSLQIRKGEKKYHFVLDAVPLDKEVNDQLMDIIFPAKAVVVPQVNKIPMSQEVVDKAHAILTTSMPEPLKATGTPIPKKKGGRPAKSK